jgi:endonuclease III
MRIGSIVATTTKTTATAAAAAMRTAALAIAELPVDVHVARLMNR